MAEIEQRETARSSLEHRAPNEPIVLSLKKKRKRARRYSKEFKDVQRIERHVTRASHRLARAVESGTADYRKNRNKSARKKKDGALRDFVTNSGLAMSRTLKDASQVPYDVSRAFDSKRSQRQLRNQLRRISRTLRRWRL
jgi:hypothetical protein